MRNQVICLSAMLCGIVTQTYAAERYTEARITQIEVSDETIVVFLAVASGDAPPMGNSGSNEPVSKPYLYLANSSTDIANRRHFLAAALTAQTLGTIARFRWEDTNSRVTVMLARD
jgi:hypothetical protein